MFIYLLPWWLGQERTCLQCQKPGFDPWVLKMLWRRAWVPTAVFLSGEPHGQRSLAGCSPRGHKELDMTERLILSLSCVCARMRAKWLQGFPGGSAGKEFTCNVGDLGLIPGLGRSPGEGNGYPLQYSGLENSMNCIGHRVTKSQTGLSNFHSLRYQIVMVCRYHCIHKPRVA